MGPCLQPSDVNPVRDGQMWEKEGSGHSTYGYSHCCQEYVFFFCGWREGFYCRCEGGNIQRHLEESTGKENSRLNMTGRLSQALRGERWGEWERKKRERAKKGDQKRPKRAKNKRMYSWKYKTRMKLIVALPVQTPMLSIACGTQSKLCGILNDPSPMATSHPTPLTFHGSGLLSHLQGKCHFLWLQSSSALKSKMCLSSNT